MTTLDTTGRDTLLENLRASRDALLSGVAGITDSQAKFKPAPDRWSIEECVEHLALVEHGLLMRLTQEAIPSPRAENLARQAEMRTLAVNRASKRRAPERARPSGQFGSLRKALQQFAANRERTIAYLTETPEDLHARTIVHPIGSMTSHEYVVFMSAHTLRHLDQIREIQQQPGYSALA